MNNKIETCTLCDSADYATIYNGKIRDGSFGKVTKQEYEVVRCKKCGLVRLLHIPFNKDFYETDEYRESYNDTHNVSDYIDMHDHEQANRLTNIGMESIRNKVVLDYGCGGGGFLDLALGVAKKTIGIEPFEGYHSSILERGHIVFKSADDALKKYKNEIDLVVSTGVIEHIDNPSKYLENAYNLLRHDGEIYLDTDNLNEISMQFQNDKFKEFFFRTAHLWFFDSTTLISLFKKMNFKNIDLKFDHHYDLSNFVIWQKDSLPSGIGKIKTFDKELNKAWFSFCNRNGYSDLICVKARK